MKRAPLQPVATKSLVGATAGLVSFQPLAPGDKVKAVSFDIGSVAAASLETCTIAMYALNSKPADATEAALGTPLFTGLAFRMKPHLYDSAGGQFVNALQFRLPLLLEIDKNTRFLALVVTTQTNNAAGTFALEVERPDEVK